MKTLSNIFPKTAINRINKLNSDLSNWMQETGETSSAYLYSDSFYKMSLVTIKDGCLVCTYNDNEERECSVFDYNEDTQEYTFQENLFDIYIKDIRKDLNAAKRVWKLSDEKIDKVEDGALTIEEAENAQSIEDVPTSNESVPADNKTAKKKVEPTKEKKTAAKVSTSNKVNALDWREWRNEYRHEHKSPFSVLNAINKDKKMLALFKVRAGKKLELTDLLQITDEKGKKRVAVLKKVDVPEELKSLSDRAERAVKISEFYDTFKAENASLEFRYVGKVLKYLVLAKWTEDAIYKSYNDLQDINESAAKEAAKEAARKEKEAARKAKADKKESSKKEKEISAFMDAYRFLDAYKEASEDVLRTAAEAAYNKKHAA